MSARDTMEYKAAIAEAKAEILIALTGEGGLGEASQEILEKIANGVEINARVPISLGCIAKSSYGSNLETVCEITGQGKASIVGNGCITLIIDGKTHITDDKIGHVENSCVLDFEFKKSLVVKYRNRTSGSTSTATSMQVFWQLF